MITKQVFRLLTNIVVQRCCFSKKTLQSYGNTSKDIMLDPKKTYRGVPYFFGIDPVSAHVNRVLAISSHLVSVFGSRNSNVARTCLFLLAFLVGEKLLFL